ncbi:SEC-C metal-binding domain-containing protein, partial [Micromonospora wenchangensis]
GHPDSSPSTCSARAGPPSVDRAAEGGPSRNAPCPCGSGRKYKRCHGAPNGGA